LRAQTPAFAFTMATRPFMIRAGWMERDAGSAGADLVVGRGAIGFAAELGG
jgi:hypothetical protein